MPALGTTGRSIALLQGVTPVSSTQSRREGRRSAWAATCVGFVVARAVFAPPTAARICAARCMIGADRRGHLMMREEACGHHPFPVGR